MTVERSSVQWGKTKIRYVVQRSARRRTVSVAVEPSGAVVLTAPHRTPLPRLDRLVRDKARWIVERVRHRREQPAAPERELVSGESLTYLGRTYRLRVRERAAPSAPRLLRGHLTIEVVPGLSERARREAVRTALLDWYRQRAEHALPVRAKRWAKKMGLSLSQIRVSEQRRRWGSCSSNGALRLNWRIIQAPIALVDYVIAHELTHVSIPHHGTVFWAALSRALPDYERRREKLRVLGASLVW